MKDKQFDQFEIGMSVIDDDGDFGVVVGFDLRDNDVVLVRLSLDSPLIRDEIIMADTFNITTRVVGINRRKLRIDVLRSLATL